MARLVVLIVLLILTVTCLGVIVSDHATVTLSGLAPDVAENIPVGLSCILVTVSAILVALIARLINHVKLSRQIILSFFFYSWRNSIYNRTHQMLPSYFEA